MDGKEQTLNLYVVTKERAGDGTLFEVTDIRGKVVSAYPMAWRAAYQLAVHLECDRAMERLGDAGDRE
jgi:hypothetical protein